MTEVPDTDTVREWLLGLQDGVVRDVEAIDGRGKFERDAWQRDAGGGGISRVLKEGAVFEQAGVGFSHVMGE
ncbi:MAG TPA: coproporphyrinogen III oxidase, partial [Gammaproteobacteria bacterium]